MASSEKTSAVELFGKIGAYKTVVQQKLGKYLNKLTPYAREYQSSIDLVLDILKLLGHSEEGLTREILNITLGDSSVGALLENKYHGALNSLEEKLSIIEAGQDDSSFIYKLENSVKTTISKILTGFLTCSVSPFIPYGSLDKIYKNKNAPGNITIAPINIPTNILDISNTLHVSPVSESGIYFYNTVTDIKYYRRDEGTEVEEDTIVADVRDKNAQRYIAYKYIPVGPENLTDEQKKKLKKVKTAPAEVKVRQDQMPPDEFIYVVKPKYTAEGLYKTEDMNAFIWYVANRGDNFDETTTVNVEDSSIMYEYNKMTWDSRRMNARNQDTARATAEDWQEWLKSRTSWVIGDSTSDFKLVKQGKEVTDLYPILQFEPSESYGHLEHLIITFPAQRYMTTKKVPMLDVDDTGVHLRKKDINLTKTIYKFNSDYLRSIKIFNWKTIVMNLLYELNGISPIPDVRFNLSLSNEIIDAKLSTLILNTIMADDMEVDDSYYTFSNKDYSEALKRMEIKKYGAKEYTTAASSAIQNPSGTPLDAMNSVSTAATMHDLRTTLTRSVYDVAGTSGSTGIMKTTLSYDLAGDSNFVYNLLYAIVRPFVRAIMSPQIMLLFCINLDVMGLINLEDLGKGDVDAISDFIFRKLSGIIKKLIVQIKDAIVVYLLEVVRKDLKKLIDEVATIILLEQLDDYIRLLNQILECIRRFGTGITLNGIDEVAYADIIPVKNNPGTTRVDGN